MEPVKSTDARGAPTTERDPTYGKPRIIRLRWSAAATFIAQATTGLLQFFLVPLYIHLLGIEAYGLLGYFAAVEALVTILDSGLSTITTREVARGRTTHEAGASLRAFLGTIERTYFGVGLGVAALIITLLFYPGADVFLSEAPAHLPVTAAGTLLAVSIATRFPLSLYRGVFAGIERFVFLSAFTCSFALIRGLGAVAILYAAPSLIAFLSWQLLVFALELFSLNRLVYRLPFLTTEQPRSSSAAPARVDWKFVRTMTVLALLSLAMTQSDRFFLGALLPLAQLGSYAAAKTLANVLYLFLAPVSSVIFPRFSLYFHANDVKSFRLLFNQSSLVAAAIVSPAATACVLFAHEILLSWSRSPSIAADASTAFALLAGGMVLNVVSGIPQAAQVAAGKPQLSLFTHLVAIVFVLPTLSFGVQAYGISGAALGFVTLNLICALLGSFFVTRWITYSSWCGWLIRRLLPGLALPSAMVCISAQLTASLGMPFLLHIALATGCGYVVSGLILAHAGFFRRARRQQRSTGLDAPVPR